MFVLLALLLLPASDAAIRLQNSHLFDEEDFKGVAQLKTDMCKSGDCKFYATIATTDANVQYTQNIVIVNPKSNEEISVFDLSKRVYAGSTEKAYYEMGKADSVVIKNKNANLESAPLALWIVSASSPYYLTAEVYEPLTFERKKATALVPITILSAYAFTLNVKAGANNAVLARTTGHDAIDRNNGDNCFTAMDFDFDTTFDGFSVAVNGPLFTLSFNTAKYPNAQVEITASTAFDFNEYIAFNKPLFISSPGFVCGSKTAPQVYRSSALRRSDAFLLKTSNNQEIVYNFDIDVVTDTAHKVSVYNPEGPKPIASLVGNFADSSNSQQLKIQAKFVAVEFTPGPPDSFYGMRVWATEVGKTDDGKTTAPPSLPTTSSTGAHQFMGLVIAIVVFAML